MHIYIHTHIFLKNKRVFQKQNVSLTPLAVSLVFQTPHFPVYTQERADEDWQKCTAHWNAGMPKKKLFKEVWRQK